MLNDLFYPERIHYLPEQVHVIGGCRQRKEIVQTGIINVPVAQLPANYFNHQRKQQEEREEKKVTLQTSSYQHYKSHYHAQGNKVVLNRYLHFDQSKSIHHDSKKENLHKGGFK